MNLKELIEFIETHKFKLPAIYRHLYNEILAEMDYLEPSKSDLFKLEKVYYWIKKNVVNKN